MEIKVEYPCGYKLEIKDAAEVPSCPLMSCPLHGKACPPDRAENKNPKDGENNG
jgi:hypothetical protein